MNIMNRVTWRAMQKNKTRTIVTIIGVILSAAMFSAVTTAAISIRDFLIRGYVYENGDYFVNYDYATDQQAQALAAKDEVTQLADYKCLGFAALEDNYSLLSAHLVGAVDETFFDTMPVYLTEGRLPENSSEILLPEQFVKIAEAYEQPIAVGDTITISMRSKLAAEECYDDIDFWDTVEDKIWEETYTVAGIYEDNRFRAEEFNYYSLLTYDDGNQSETLWHRLYVKTSASDAQCILLWGVDEFGARKFRHNDLLEMYGTTSYTNINDMIAYLALILIALIMGASVSLIHNAFSISVSERTKQFGLLSSVGATKKQLRHSVLFEACVISMIGIPIGLFCGYGGIAVVFAVLGENFENQFSFCVDGRVSLYADLSWAAFLIAAAVCAVTVLISAWIPANRATKIMPLEAIRQSSDIKARAKDVKVGKLTYKLFGLPGALAKKYFGISRRKYRATILSLVFSLILFVVAGYFSQQLSSNYSGTVQAENYDFDCTSVKEDPAENEAIFQQALNAQGVEKSVFVSSDVLGCVLPTDMLNADYRSINGWLTDYSGPWCVEMIRVVYLEDTVLEEHLRSAGIDPSRYIGVDDPPALICMQDTSDLIVNEDGTRTIKTYHLNPFLENADTVTLFPWDNAPTELYENYENFWTENRATDSGELLWELSVYDVDENGVFYYYKKVFRQDDSGNWFVDYYVYDIQTGTTGALAGTSSVSTGPMELTIGDVLDERPFGVWSGANSTITLILPMSARRENYNGMTYLRLNASNYEQALQSLTSIEGLFVEDEVESSRNARGLLLTVQVCSAGFIILISLICVANVFNTISTNIALRRRDFGMLRSVGMKDREIYRMMSFECIIYGFQAFAWGFPISLALCYGIYCVFSTSYGNPFEAPWFFLLIGTLCIILVVFITMLYAVSKLKKDNPIEAIRMENL